eukprot:IDg16500t1
MAPGLGSCVQSKRKKKDKKKGTSSNSKRAVAPSSGPFSNSHVGNRVLQSNKRPLKKGENGRADDR